MGGGQVCNNSRPFKGEGFASLSAKILGISDGPGFDGHIVGELKWLVLVIYFLKLNPSPVGSKSHG